MTIITSEIIIQVRPYSILRNGFYSGMTTLYDKLPS